MNTSPAPRPIVGLLVFFAVAVFISQLTACGGSSPQPPVPVLKSVQLFPATSTIDIGQTQQFTAWGTYSDGLSQDISSQVTWSSSNQTVATISSSGLALGQSQGSSTISATFNSSASYFPVQNDASREATLCADGDSLRLGSEFRVARTRGAPPTSYAGCDTSQRPTLMRLSAMIPNPTHLFIPSVP